MRTISFHEAGYLNYIDRYDLDDIYTGKSEIPSGVKILFLIGKDRRFSFEKAYCKADGDVDDPGYTVRIYEDQYRNYFRNIRQLTKEFHEKALEKWTIIGTYQNCKVDINGFTNDTEIGVSYDKNADINLIPFLMDIEENTFRYHSFDGDLVDAMQSRYGLSMKKTVLALSRLEKYPDIWEEFTEGMTQDPFRFPKDGAVSVEGHTAEELFRSTKLKELGAYNYLIYLREQPERALADLEKGLPNLK